MNMKIFATLTCILLSLTLVAVIAPRALAVQGPTMDTLQFKFYVGQTNLFAALQSGAIDIMAWPLTATQYATAIGTTTITVAPYFDLGDYEIAYNNNFTDPSHKADRKAMNYTDFRQAISCLVDKNGLVAGPQVNNFGTRIDTALPRPILNNWVNYEDSYYDTDGTTVLGNYPWEYDTAHSYPLKALTILYRGGWYDLTYYKTFQNLVDNYTSGALLSNKGTNKGVIYPVAVDPYGKLYALDTYLHPRGGSAVDKLVGYIRSDHAPREAAGLAFNTQLNKIGINTDLNDLPSGSCYTPCFVDHDFDFYTAGWSFGVHPLHFYSSYTPVGIYAGGPNQYMIDDGNLTYWATIEYPSATAVGTGVHDTTTNGGLNSMHAAYMCQDILVQEACFVTLYSSASYMGYKAGTSGGNSIGYVGVYNARGYGLTTDLDMNFMSMKNVAFTPGPPPTNDIITYGTLNPPVSINPIFSSWVWDYEVCDRIFTGVMNTNPYNPTSVGKSPGGSDLPWMAYDWKLEFYNATYNGPVYTAGQGLNANVTYYCRNDITWQDGQPWTVEDFNYTMYINGAYGDSWGFSDASHIIGTQEPTPYIISFQFDSPSIWFLYSLTYDQIPKHLYKYIVIPAGAHGGSNKSGLHGEWPGKQALNTEFISNGLGITYDHVTGTDGGNWTWIGTNMWKYRALSYVSGEGGGITLDAYSGFWMKMTAGEITFEYTWSSATVPSPGYYQIGLGDLTKLALAYGTTGFGHAVPFKLGGLHVWEPGCNLASPSGSVGLGDLVTLALNYNKKWGLNP